MGKVCRNVKLFSVNSNYGDEFYFYLDFSGKREYLMSYKRNGLIFNFFKDGVPIEKLYRWHPRQASYLTGKKLETSIRYIKRRVEEYMDYREEFNEAI